MYRNGRLDEDRYRKNEDEDEEEEDGNYDGKEEIRKQKRMDDV